MVRVMVVIVIFVSGSSVMCVVYYMIQAAAKRREWDSAPANPDEPRVPVGIDPVLPAQRHEVPGAIWWERRSYVEGVQVS